MRANETKKTGRLQFGWHHATRTLRFCLSGSVLLLATVLVAQVEPGFVPDPEKEIIEDPPKDPEEPPPAAAASSGGSAASLGLPGGNSSVPGANDLLNFQTDLFTGRFSYSVPIVVAPGRQGSEPKLALTYNSAAGNGWCGVGWSLEVGFIERDTKKGIPVKWGLRNPIQEYDDSGGFIFNLGGANGSLVNVGGNEYRNEIDRDFLKFKLYENYWEVTDKSGTKFYFGETSQSRMDHPDSGWIVGASKSTFRWALNRVVDPNGNETTVSYSTFDNYLYLSTITYNGNVNGGVSATHSLEFVLGNDRTDQPLGFRSSYRVQLKKRLTDIIVKVSNERVRRYALIYTSSPSTFRSLLQSVVLYGTDDTSSLPPLTFTYQVKPFGFKSSVPWTGIDAQGNGVSWGALDSTTYFDFWHKIVALQDIDGDALPDRITRKEISSSYDRYHAQRNTGSGFGVLKTWGPLTSQNQPEAYWGGLAWTDAKEAAHLGFVDINGDGFPDRVMRHVAGTAFNVETNKGLKGLTASFQAPGADWGPLEHQTGTGTNWTAVSSQLAVVQGGCLKSEIVSFFDINGDGLPDRVMRREASPFTNYIVQHNMGGSFSGWRRHGTLLSQGMTGAPGYGGSSGRNCYDLHSYDFLTPVDINGDGLPDRVMQNGSGGGDFVVQFNRGVDFAPTEDPWGPIDSQGIPNEGWASPQIGWFSPFSTRFQPAGEDRGVLCTLIDMNGDGLPDRVMRTRVEPYNDFKIQFNTGSGFTSTYDFGPLEHNSEWFLASPQWIDIENDIFIVSRVDLVDINGDALPDRVWYESPTTWRVQLSKGPFPDLLSRIDNGIGGKVDVTYAPSTKFNNRDKPLTGDPWDIQAKALLPFVVYVVETVGVRDGFGNTNLTTYSYTGGMFDGKRREFRGFSLATMTDVYGAKKQVFFHQGGGWDRSAEGEFQDAGSVVKKGIPFRTEMVGTNGLTNTITLNKVEEAMLHANGWCFPFISQSIQLEYEGLSTYRATAQRFLYDTNTGNLLKVSNLGEVTSVDPATHTFTDAGSDSVFTHTTYASLGEILNRPSTNKITSDEAGAVKLREALFAYDNRGNLTNQQSWLTGTTYLTTVGIQYDQYGNPFRMTDAAGIVTTNTYDATYRMFVEEKITGGFTNIFRYNPHSGGVLLSIDGKGIVSSNAYDVFFRLLETSISTNAYGPTALWQERYAYNLGGISGNTSYNWVRKRVYDPGDTANGHETYTYVDGLGRTIQTRVEAETGQFRVSDAFYDLRGSPLFATLPRFSAGNGYTIITGEHLGTYTEYDPFGRPYKVTPAVKAVFDANGDFTDIYGTGGDTGSPVAATVTAFSDGTNPWATVVTDAEQKVKKFYHDAYGRTTNIIEVTSGGNHNTTYRYDRIGNLTNVVDDALNTTRIAYDNLGRKTSIVDQDMGTWSYGYDAADRLIQQTDAKNQKLEFVYTADPLGRLTERKIFNANNVLVATISYVYDSNQGESAYFVPKGSLFKVTDREGWTKFGYDAQSRATNSTRYLATNQTSYTILTEYDDADRVSVLTYPGAPLTQIKYSYDSAGHLTEVRSLAGTGSTEIFYSLPVFNERDQLTSVKYGANQVINYSYYSNSIRLRQKTASVVTNLQNLTYEYDRVSNLKKLMDAARPSGTNSATITTLSYDDLHRLTSVNSAALGVRNYWCNSIGNLILNEDNGTEAYNYTGGHRVTSANNKLYSYDECGNMIIRDLQVLEYDEENRLKKVSCPSPVITFGYADDGTRLWKKVSPNNLTVWIGGIYEVRGTKGLCHVYANGQLIATFEQGGLFAYLPQNKVVGQLASTASTLTRWFHWPLQNGRTPITVCIVTLLGILCLSVFSRWQERSDFLNRRTQRSQRNESGSAHPFIPSSCHPVFGSLFALFPPVNNSESVPRSAFRPPRFLHQGLSVWLIVGLVLATTETNVHAQTYSPVFYYYHPDHLGSSNIITDRNGVIIQQYEYTSYGRERVRTSAAAFPLSNRYTGQEFDAECGLYFYQSRYYDPELGRFIQPDSTVPDIGNPQTLNRYTYAFNSPHNFTDPTGYFNEGPVSDSYYSDYGRDVFDWYFNAVVVQDFLNTEYGPYYLPPIPAPNLQPIPLPWPTTTPSVTPAGVNSPSLGNLATGFAKTVAGWAFDSVHDQGVFNAALQYKMMGLAADVGGRAFGHPNQGSWFYAWASAHQALMSPAARAGWYDPNNPGVRFANFASIALTRGRAGSAAAPKGPKLFDIIPYSKAAPGFEKHHGVLDAWARANIPGYVGETAPTIVLSPGQHNATRAVFNTWRAEQGWSRLSVDWTRVSAGEMQSLTHRMFEAAGVPKDVANNYFREFHRHIYGH
jgi:RHS repeat-associated protein